MGSEESSSSSLQKKIYWRSASWSSSRSDGGSLIPDSSSRPPSNGGHHHRSGIPNAPLTPRSKTRSSLLPPLQPLSIARRSLDEWPRPGSDDLGEWPHNPPTPSSSSSAAASSSLETISSKNQIALFDKECSKVADHVYLGGESVARNRDILRLHGITHVLNCVGSVCPEYFKSDLVYKTLWLQDSPSEDITSILYDVFDYFEDVRGQGGRVLVHCCQGVSRSASLVIAYLMWREGRSFDDAFQLVRAARGIANPNMGFACQLLQCQKRVHAVPLSPNSVLRMYRMAPHSPYDPLHLVPKMLAEPSPGGLDSRGAFIVHVASAIYVWVGKGCDPVMEKDARAAAFQVVRYERVSGPVILVEEGDEPAEVWDAFSSPAVIGCGGGSEKSWKVGLVGKKRVESYNVDFELFYKVITGGVVPPFPSSEDPGQETCLPARESNWSILRRKFISGATCRVFSESALARERVQVLAADVATLPPLPSPSSPSSDSSISSKSCLDSPSISPSTCSSPSLTPTNMSDPLSLLSRPSLKISNNLEPLKPCLQAACLPTKGLARSIAERRGSFSLKLPLGKDAKDAVLFPSKALNVSPNCVGSKVEVLDKSNSSNPYTSQVDALDNVNYVRQVRDMESLSRSAVDSFDNAQSLPNSTQSVEIDLHTQTSIYRWPDMEKLTKFTGEDIDSKSVLFLLTPKSGRGEESDMLLYMWIGSRFELVNKQSQGKSHKDVDGATDIDWSQIGCDFLARMDLPNDFPVKVVKEEEREELLELLKLN
ncbi:protein-tyrosine-phosphatase MKP1 isoform X1 [Iris pallida]|uniref:Protein-tyrosine-phosphatase MKP1 isoform X1 n=1 Tax=Iris pallida TaxID=29817 RepID=A0AAX6GYK3_IRIPA|nr:protein-tyrosine-phosphatase MKP1 isoform X1 [Iris pallida]